MNCRSEVLELTVEARQVEEAMLALLHTILLHRSTGKFHYKKEGTYSIGTVGTQDIDCDFIDFTFVRVSSEELDRVISKAVTEFKVGRPMWNWIGLALYFDLTFDLTLFFIFKSLFRMPWATRVAMAWGKYHLSFTRRKSPAGHFPTSAYLGKCGASR